MKTRVQAQHLQPGDIVGSGEVVKSKQISSIHWPSNKVSIRLDKDNDFRFVLWGKHTMINVERKEEVDV